jgi:hypothetical protein
MGCYMSHPVHGIQERRIDLRARGGIAVLSSRKPRPVLLCWIVTPQLEHEDGSGRVSGSFTSAVSLYHERLPLR